jgi:hypothetical protein
MRYVTALFDAPIPAQVALESLRSRGFTSADLFVVPELPASGLRVADSYARPWREQGLELGQMLAEMGIPDDEGAVLEEAIARGAILIAVRSPSLSAPHAEAALEHAMPADLAEHEARWQSDPDWRYGWSTVAPPLP